MIVHQPEAKVAEALDLLLEAGDVVVVDDDVAACGFSDPRLVLEVEPPRWESDLGKKIQIDLQIKCQRYASRR